MTSPGTSRKSSTARSAIVGSVTLTAAAVLYALAVGTSSGRELEASIVALELDGAPRRAAVWGGLMTNALTVALATAALLLMVARSAGPIDAVLVAAIPCGAVGLTAGLKAVLPLLDPVHGESQRALGEGFFPSGHAAAGTALCLAALVASRHRRGARAPAFAAAGATILAVPHFMTAWHHVADVLGAMLLTTAWTALLVPWLRGRSPTRPHHQAGTWWLLLVAPGALLVLAAVAKSARLVGFSTGQLDPALVVAAAATAAVASGCAYALQRIMEPVAQPPVQGAGRRSPIGRVPDGAAY